MRESLIEAYLVKKVKALGGEVRKVKWLGRNGAPDRLVLVRGYGGVSPQPFFVELKATGKTPESHQLREHARLEELGVRVVVIDSLEKVDELLK